MKLITGLMPEASRFDAGLVEMSYPLARLASEEVTKRNLKKTFTLDCSLYDEIY